MQPHTTVTTYDTKRSLWVKQSFNLHDFCLGITYHSPSCLIFIQRGYTLTSKPTKIMNNLSCILNNAWPLLQETKKIHWQKDKESSILTVTMNTCSRECKLRNRNQDNVSIHKHLYRWTGQAKRPTDGRWTRLLVVKLKAYNKGSLCAFSCCRWEPSSNSGGEREGSGGWNQAHAARLGMRSTGPLATHVWLCGV